MIELMIAIVIIAILSMSGLTALRKRDPRYERDLFIAQLNGLMRLAWHRAIVKNSTIRVSFDLKQKQVQIEERDSDLSIDRFVRIKQVYRSSSMKIPSWIHVKHFFVEGADEMNHLDRQTTQIWFYMSPRGVTQQVRIDAVDVSDSKKKKRIPFSLQINPFNGQFSSYVS